MQAAASLMKGTYSLTATYLGDANLNGSSGTVPHQAP
jgi:hypothetical protein